MGAVVELTRPAPNLPRVRILRNAMRLTQRELAERVGVEPVTVRRWEHGKEPIPRRHRVRMAELFAVTEGHLMGDPPPSSVFRGIDDAS